MLKATNEATEKVLDHMNGKRTPEEVLREYF